MIHEKFPKSNKWTKKEMLRQKAKLGQVLFAQSRGTYFLPFPKSNKVFEYEYAFRIFNFIWHCRLE